MKKIILLVILIMCASNTAYSADLDSWKDQILYFVLLDRFYDGNKTNCKKVDRTDLLSFHGGDIAGLEQKLGYLKELGITGIWVSPFLKNRPDSFFGQEAYHGYWPYDFFSIDERFGTQEELLSLREAMKKQNMRFIFDMVINHMGYDAPFVEEHKDWFNPNVNIENWDDPEELKNRCIFGLPDFASQRPEVRKFFCKVAKHWIDMLKPDAFRLDAVKHIHDDFWEDFNSNARNLSEKDFFILGEYLHGDPVCVNNVWRNAGFNSLFDFPLYYTMLEVFAKGGDCRKLASRLYFDRYYPDAGMLATLVDNHDVHRFLTSCGGNLDKYKLALAFLMTIRGIPTLCYGDEQGLRGYNGKLPHNRTDMIFSTKNPVYTYVKDLISMRKECKPLRRGIHCHIFADNDAYVFGRLTEDEVAIVVLNNSDEEKTIEAELPFVFLDEGRVKAMYGDKTAVAIVENSKLKIKMAARRFAVYMPKSDPGFYSAIYDSYQKRFECETAWGYRDVILSLGFDKLPAGAEAFAIGNCDELGNWDKDKAVKLTKAADGKYEATVRLPKGKIFEYKGLYKQGKRVTWQNGENIIMYVK